MTKEEIKTLNKEYNELCHRKAVIAKKLRNINVLDLILIELNDRFLKKPIIVNNISIFCETININNNYISIIGLVELKTQKIDVIYNRNDSIDEIMNLFRFENKEVYKNKQIVIINKHELELKYIKDQFCKIQKELLKND